MENAPVRRLREPGTETGSGLLIREQEEHAARQITRGITAAKERGNGIDAATARVIAAALHTGPGTTLEHFAATGALNPTTALQELDGGRIELHQIPWVTALWDFLERITNPSPDLPEADHVEPTPQIFVQARDPDRGLRIDGQWLDVSQSVHDLAARMTAIADQHGIPGTVPAVSAWVGFHQLQLDPAVRPSQLAAHARGIAEFGEIYALYATHLGYPVDTDELAIRYEGSYDSMTAFIASTPIESRRFVLSTADNEIDPTRGHALDRYEDALRRNYLCLDGKRAVHVFHRQMGTPKEVG
jgi:hypothetical protein